MASNIRRTRPKFFLHILRRGTSTGRIFSRQSFAQPHHQYRLCRKESGLYTLIFMVHYGRRDRQTERQQETRPVLGPKGLIARKSVTLFCAIPLFSQARLLLLITAHNIFTLLCSVKMCYRTALASVHMRTTQQCTSAYLQMTAYFAQRRSFKRP